MQQENLHEKLIEELLACPTAKQWKYIGIRQHHGICVPLFSLHSEKSCGIGEFPDLLPLISWCKTLGLDVLQLLPLNDTGPNSSPYSALSAFALNPLHLGLAHLPGLTEHPRLVSMLNEIQHCNHTERVEYTKVFDLREHFLKDYFQLTSSVLLTSPEYIKFCEDNLWLKGYALFKALKIQCHWQSWSLWSEEIRECSTGQYSLLSTKLETDISYHSLLQFLCFQQMKEVKRHADSLGIFIKGDIPILIDHESADLWLNRSLFNTQLTAGAPPDAYSADGQNWKFPLYNWEEMEHQGYTWWKDRLRYASHFYHIFRIDHVVGFFRIWGIPIDAQATEGSFFPSDPDEALKQGVKLLTMMIEASDMLPIGEDLGTVPPEVRQELKNLGICGTRVMRWERDWEGDLHFITPENYPPLSITTVSTHDSSTLQLWWTQSMDEAHAYCQCQGWHYQAPLPPEYQFALLYASHHTASLFHINLLQEYLAFIPEFIHVNPEEERINCPGIISDKNWSYRFKPSVEKMIGNPELARLILDLKKTD